MRTGTHELPAPQASQQRRPDLLEVRAPIRWGTLVSGQRLPFDPHPVDLSDEDRAIVPLYRFEDGVARLTINHSDGREVYTMHLDTCEGALKVG